MVAKITADEWTERFISVLAVKFEQSRALIGQGTRVGFHLVHEINSVPVFEAHSRDSEDETMRELPQVQAALKRHIAERSESLQQANKNLHISPDNVDVMQRLVAEAAELAMSEAATTQFLSTHHPEEGKWMKANEGTGHRRLQHGPHRPASTVAERN